MWGLLLREGEGRGGEERTGKGRAGEGRGGEGSVPIVPVLRNDH